MFSKVSISGVIAASVVIAGWAMGSAAWAQAPAPAPGTTAAPPAAPGPSKAAYEVAGFRGARFGMDEAQVRAAIQGDFQAKPEAIRLVPNAMERTTALIVSLPTLDPGPGPASVVYILGYQTKKLIQVNLVWSQNAAADKTDGGPFLVAGVQLANYFNGFAWRDGKVSMGVPAGPNTLLLFAAEDAKTGAVQVIVDGVTLENKGGKVETKPQRPGSLSLRVSYIADRLKPDIFKLEPGKF
ncbi:MAG: hypothetical protein KF889_19135 [Alphaproteobacteria bacterium]|nr:hypothetical protein [Alphaproteobacteria bacterium]MCW5744110.1 hypothetical protein [Alphaproteobacteria bacterium]